MSLWLCFYVYVIVANVPRILCILEQMWMWISDPDCGRGVENLLLRCGHVSKLQTPWVWDRESWDTSLNLPLVLLATIGWPGVQPSPLPFHVCCCELLWGWCKPHMQGSDLQSDALVVDKFGWLCTKLRWCKILLTAFGKDSHCVASQGRNDFNS